MLERKNLPFDELTPRIAIMIDLKWYTISIALYSRVDFMLHTQGNILA
jgi:hypothetical protein